MTLKIVTKVKNGSREGILATTHATTLTTSRLHVNNFIATSTNVRKCNILKRLLIVKTSKSQKQMYAPTTQTTQTILLRVLFLQISCCLSAILPTPFMLRWVADDFRFATAHRPRTFTVGRRVPSTSTGSLSQGIWIKRSRVSSYLDHRFR